MLYTHISNKPKSRPKTLWVRKRRQNISMPLGPGDWKSSSKLDVQQCNTSSRNRCLIWDMKICMECHKHNEHKNVYNDWVHLLYKSLLLKLTMVNGKNKSKEKRFLNVNLKSASGRRGAKCVHKPRKTDIKYQNEKIIIIKQIFCPAENEVWWNPQTLEY